MKVALQLSGYFNNKADPTSGTEGYGYIQREILEKVERIGGQTDVFIHSWEPDKEEMIRSLYNPVEADFVKQVPFGQFVETFHLAEQEYYDEGFDRKNSMFAACNLLGTLSFLYGRQRANDFRVMHEIKNDVEYDCVIIARFDLGQRDKFGNWEFRVSQIRFDPEADMDGVFTSMWDQLNHGLPDQWFYGEPELMNKVANCFDSCIDRKTGYFQKESDYEKMVTKGWPDSRPWDIFDPKDPNQFTNEIFLDEGNKSKELMKFGRWQCINNHVLYKYHMIATGLYDKLRFV